jgi:penicillin-binding protein 1C
VKIASAATRTKRRLYLRWAVITLAGGIVLCDLGLRCVPIPRALLRPPIQSIMLTDRNGIPLRETRVAERFSRELALEEVPPHVIAAVLAAEDKRFFSHHGIDWLATGRALFAGITHGRIVSGASTITQQLVKISARRPRTWRAKLIESVTALRLEQTWSKEQILAAYLNRLDFGNLNIGLSAAADYYFGKPVSDLSDAEAAFLAGLPKNPRKLNPHASPESARRRQLTVLERMRANRQLDPARFDHAVAETLALRPPQRRFRAPHFVEMVLRAVAGIDDPGLRQNARDTGPGSPIPATAQIRTTLDFPLNERVETIVRDRLAQLHEQNVRNAAAVVIDNATGDVIALVGSENYFSPGAGQVNGAWAPRSAGSALKPFTYLLALERGTTPATIVADVRSSFPADGSFYRPENYNRRCYGPVRYRTALASSLNIPAVKVLLAAGGPAALHARLREVGLTTLNRPPEVYGLGLTLGNCEARLLEMTNAYASLARLGEFRPWRVLPTSNVAAHRYSRPELVWQIADILSDNSARTLAFGMNSALRFDYPVACKTGTSTDFRDNWTVGFTPEFSVGVWVGNFDGSPMREVSGVSGAGPILHAIFDYLHANHGTTWYRTPEAIVERTIHPLTGKLLADGDVRGVREKFVAGQLPAPESANDYDPAGKVQLSVEFDEWFKSAENSLRDRAVLATGRDELLITSPQAGSVYVVDPDVPSSRRIPLITSGGAQVQWESESLTCHSDAGINFAEAAEGEHRLVAVDRATGRRAETRIRIRFL